MYIILQKRKYTFPVALIIDRTSSNSNISGPYSLGSIAYKIWIPSKIILKLLSIYASVSVKRDPIWEQANKTSIVCHNLREPTLEVVKYDRGAFFETSVRWTVLFLTPTCWERGFHMSRCYLFQDVPEVFRKPWLIQTSCY